MKPTILGLLGVLFVGLKLLGYIEWSWWYVTMPFWGPIAIVACIWVLTVVGVVSIASLALLLSKGR